MLPPARSAQGLCTCGLPQVFTWPLAVYYVSAMMHDIRETTYHLLVQNSTLTSFTHFHTHSPTLSHSRTFMHSQVHIYTFTPSPSHTHEHPCTHTCALTLSHTHTHPCTPTCTLTLLHIHPHTLIHIHARPHAYLLSHIHPHTLMHMHTVVHSADTLSSFWLYFS